MSVISGSFRSRVRASIEGPVAGVFGRLGLTPNALTLIGFGIAVVAAWFASQQSWLAAGLLVAFGAVFDLFDGALARATNTVSKFGAFMDSTFDRAGEAVVYIGIAVGLFAPTLLGEGRLSIAYDNVHTDAGALWAILAMASSFMVSYTRAKSESLGFASGTGMANVGLAPREVRMAILTLGLVVAGLGGALTANFGPTYWWWTLVASLALITILATITTIQRIFFVYRQSKSTNQEVTK